MPRTATNPDTDVTSTSLKGRSALVCGSSQGIGRACAIEMARRGAEVTLMARHDEGLKAVLAKLPAEFDQAHGSIVADFTDWRLVAEKARRHAAERGPVHIVLNNTGGPPAGSLFEATAEQLLAAFSQHVLSFQGLVQALVPGMREAGYGRIVNIISTSVVQPIRGLGVSNVIRGAVGNWARTLAGELGPFGITVNSILPGYTHTARLDSIIKGRASRAGSDPTEIEQTMIAGVPAARFGTPEEIAAVAAFLATQAASYVNGVNLPVDGGRLAVQ